MKKTNYTAIGLFVIGAVVLAVISIIVFGSGHFLESNIFYTTSFDKSVNGLSKGAPVMFRGIKIGEVTDIQLSFEKKSPQNHKPHNEEVIWPINVTFTLFPNSFAFTENRTGTWFDDLLRRIFPSDSEKIMERWIYEMVTTQGLRAQLQTQSYLTGQLFIELDLFPEEKKTDAIVSMINQHVVPTRISAFERLYLSLNQNNFSDQVTQLYKIADVCGKFFSDGRAENLLHKVVSIANNLDATMIRLNTLITQIEGNGDNKFATDTKSLVASLNSSAKNLEAVLQKLNQPRTDEMLENVSGIVANVSVIIKRVKTFVSPDTTAGKVLPVAATSMFALLGTIDTTLTKFSTFMDTLQQKVPPVLENANDSLTAFRQSAQPLAEVVQKLNAAMIKLDQATIEGTALLSEARRTLDPSSPLHSEITRALQDARQAAQSIRALADMLTNQPEALLRGRQD